MTSPVGLAYDKAPGIRPLGIDGTVPTPAAVRAKTYAYQRPTFYYTNGEPSGEAKAFIDFTLSAKGAAIVSQVGFVPLK